MKHFLIYLSLFILCSFWGCKSNSISNFYLPDQNEYNQIIAEILTQDIAFIKQRKFFSLNSQIDILNIQMQYEEFDNSLLPPVENGFPYTSLSNLVASGVISSKNPNDSLYLVFQIDSMKVIQMHQSIKNKIQFKSNGKIKTPELKFSVPIFNSIKNKAFVQANFEDNVILNYTLYKVNNKWVLINTEVKRMMRCG